MSDTYDGDLWVIVPRDKEQEIIELVEKSDLSSCWWISHTDEEAEALIHQQLGLTENDTLLVLSYEGTWLDEHNERYSISELAKKIKKLTGKVMQGFLIADTDDGKCRAEIDPETCRLAYEFSDWLLDYPHEIIRKCGDYAQELWLEAKHKGEKHA